MSVREFGAFVDLGGGVQGLLHVSEMGWSRGADPSQFATPGDDITVKVLRVDEATQRIALGLKQLAEDPWTNVASTYHIGQVVSGRITRHAEFGAFVELAPGVEGLAHASTFPPSGQHRAWARLVPVGTTAAFKIVIAPVPEGTTTDSLAADAADDAAALARATAAPSGGLGSLADKLRDALGPRDRSR